MIKKDSCRLYITALLLILPILPLSAWETAIAGVLTTPPAQGMDGRIYSSADDRALHCLDSVTGREYWNYRPGRRLKLFTVVSPDGSILVINSINEFISVSPGGRELWRIPLDSEPVLPPAVDPYGTIYLLGSDSVLFCIDRRGAVVWKMPWTSHVTGLFATHRGLLLTGGEGTSFVSAAGVEGEGIDESFSHILARDEELYWQSPGGRWKIFNPAANSLEESQSPLAEGVIFPDEKVLVSANNKIIAGRQDWFMEAMEAGEESYDPLYQSGGNPGRSSGMIVIPGEMKRAALFAARGGAPLLPLLKAEPSYLNELLLELESAKSFQELVSKNPDYDLVLQEVIADSHVVSYDVHRKSLDSYSRYRIYRILGQWGNLKSREILLNLTVLESDPNNLTLLLEGLGRIGLDSDGRSMLAIQKAHARYPSNRNLNLSAVSSAAALGRYNGNASVRTMMIFYAQLQQSSADRAVMNRIRDELKSF